MSISSMDWRNDDTIRTVAITGRYTSVDLKRMFNIPEHERTVQRWTKELFEKNSDFDNLVSPPEWAAEDEDGQEDTLDIPDGIGFDEQILQLSGDYGLSSDWHIPHQSKRVLEQFVRECHKQGIGKAVMIGDGMDANQFSKRGRYLGYHRRWQDDVEVAEKVFTAMGREFDEFVYIMGNHDEWYEQHYRGHVDADWLLPRMFRTPNNFRFTRFEQARVVSTHPDAGPMEFRLIHGANVSAANPLGVAQKLSTKFGCGIVMGHQHWKAEGRDISGRFQAVCLGCVADPAKLLYTIKSPTTHPKPTQGFAILKQGWVKSYDPEASW